MIIAESGFTYASIPPEAIVAVRPALGQLVEGILAAVKDENPIYAEVLSGPEGMGIRLGIEQAVKSFLEAIERGKPPAGETAEAWQRLGEAEFAGGWLRCCWKRPLVHTTPRGSHAPPSSRAALGAARAGVDRAWGDPVRASDEGRRPPRTVIVRQDDELAGARVARALAPLDALPGSERERLVETLAAWLAHQRHTPGIAAELHVHPQTVRYRVAKLPELFGDTLDSPDGRFGLELALRAARAPDV